MTEKTTETKVEEAQAAALEIAGLSDEARSDALHSIADAIDANHDEILAANEKDVAEAEDLLEAGEYTQALVDRLELSPSKLESITDMVRSVAAQDDPLGTTQTARELDENLELYKNTVPIGVVGTIFESRPDALVQIASLCLRSGNAVILKGGSEASHSNRVLFELIEEATADVPDGWAQLIEARADVDTVLGMDDGTVESARVAATGAADRATRLTAVEDALVGTTLDADSAASAAHHAADGIDPSRLMDDTQASAEYRSNLLGVYTERALAGLADGQGTTVAH